ncbi:aldo/keto reductase [Zhouia sp. PK063]|uniref:aldo/keto reductase n=1 Tax=Zhouia sp. PK063 TaxID=3373602 RepID=UPI0037B7683C
MKKITLGKTDLKTAPIVFGGNVFGWTLDKAASFKILDEFIDLGFNMIDTADVYSRWVQGNKGGESETIIGEWLKTRSASEDIIVATKVGSDMGQGEKDLSAKYILKAVEDSLNRLGKETLDLYFTHWDDDITPVDETMSAYAQLVKEGKVRYVGASNLSPERLLASIESSKTHGFPKYQVFQPEYNLYDREDYEKYYAALVKEQELSVVSYYSLASGFLTGKYRNEADFDKSVRGNGAAKYLNEKGKTILHMLDELSEAHNTTPAAVSLAWLIAQPHVTPIASATKSNHLKAFREAAELELTRDDLNKLNASNKEIVL